VNLQAPFLIHIGPGILYHPVVSLNKRLAYRRGIVRCTVSGESCQLLHNWTKNRTLKCLH